MLIQGMLKLTSHDGQVVLIRRTEIRVVLQGLSDKGGSAAKYGAHVHDVASVKESTAEIEEMIAETTVASPGRNA